MLEPKVQASRNKLLGSAEIRRMLTDYVRRRVSESDVDDVVQTVLVEALSSERVPDERTELRKWLTGVARHKIADLHRRVGREKPSELPEIETAPAPVEEHHLVEWAEREAKKSSKDADATLRWMAREGEGDKLEHIAAEEQLPAATVRQRVSRMRRWMKERWLAELAAAAAAFSILAFLVYRFVLAPKGPEVVREERPVPTATVTARPVAPSPLERAAELRRTAIPTCGSDAVGCLQKLDEAKRLDPAGDTAPAVEEARKQANTEIDRNKLLGPEPAPQDSGPSSTSSSTSPTSTPAPTAPPKAAPTNNVAPTTTTPSKPSFDEKKQAPAKPPPKAPSKMEKSSFNDATQSDPVKPSSVVLGDVPEGALSQATTSGPKKK